MISIIIPAYNEEKQLPVLLKHLEVSSSGDISEIIIVDGGSTDNTSKIAKDHPKVFYVPSEKGRAVQMNTGARLAKTEILYFLHADSFPPKNFDALIIDKVNNGDKAGCFQMKFDKDHWWLNLMGFFTKINHISCRGGDQSLFVTKELFNELGGFDESYQVYEDNEFIKRIYESGNFTVIKSWITTSARLYEKMGIWNTQLLFAEIYWKRRLGASADELYNHYYKRISS
ncbi:TIGR04283 family arsenosugar biosynthesis glycosyltransferase [Christiangramia sediminis]|uniref:TIGR04283 family arsenosugar biosynthesis glycosyltransferase n=1 Tax=Christiangramia sediminis TaxID=2881336 RepID=A0A9X1RYV6_9FLAO|nr:TIGR04283 family arsenosugar biosynthesis glycosyltransferase [Christiangramia sediminis]MCB7482242.1 TIGR04283 family arsenosugar biosynthesis glycosyltransferase [Christiangramia sediminis]